MSVVEVPCPHAGSFAIPTQDRVLQDHLLLNRPDWNRGYLGMVRRIASLLGIAGLLAIVGCAEPEPVRFIASERLDGEEFADRPISRSLVIEKVEELFGDSPYSLKVPEGAGLREGGRYLAPLTLEEGNEAPVPVTYTPAGETNPVQIVGGQALYHKHCLHCHGVTGDGEGPTAAFLYPRPRDYRQGRFKFTSTQTELKPTRDDLRRVLLYGIHGTSMPAFKTSLTAAEIEQVIDYVIFLSLRGEVEDKIIEITLQYFEEDLTDELFLEDYAFDIEDILFAVFDMWETTRYPDFAVIPETPRVPDTPESIARGRELFLGISQDVKVQCVGCHGFQADGNGTSWVDEETFNAHVFTFNPNDPEPLLTLKKLAEDSGKRWGDEWNDPLRPANLQDGTYKGGRRPIDLYWRIATGINGSGMPGHADAFRDPDDLWHLVNFILALPHDRTLLRPDELQKFGLMNPTSAALPLVEAPLR